VGINTFKEPVAQLMPDQCTESQIKSYIASPVLGLSKEAEQIAAFVRRLYCKTCKAAPGEKRRQSRVEQTREPPDGPLLPGPDEVGWKRFVRGRRR
jgi:hypothetical protein